MPVNRGEIRVVHGEGAIRLCLILTSYADSLEVALVHSSSDLATSFDAVIEPDLTKVSFPIVIQSDLRGIVSLVQVTGSVVAYLDEATLTTVSDVIAGKLTGLPHIWTGTPLTREQDRRWSFKQCEGRDLDALTRQHTFD